MQLTIAVRFGSPGMLVAAKIVYEEGQDGMERLCGTLEDCRSAAQTV